MKVHVWSAFASNNSGSYTLVGRFHEEARAAEVAAELAEVTAAHEAWRKERDTKGWPEQKEPSPLEVFAAKHGLSLEQQGDDWPRYSDDNTPRVWAMGHQVFIHHDYTLSLPGLFGELMYKRGGRVELELEHTHHPLVGVFELWMPHAGRAQRDVPALAAQVLEALHAEDGPLVQLVPEESPPAWRTRAGERAFGEADLTVGAVFTDLVAGFTAVARIAREHGFGVRVKVFEAWSGDGDPLAFLRPSHPPLKQGLFDVVLTGAGHAPKEVVLLLQELRRLVYREARQLLDSAPVVVARQRPRGAAEALANRLRKTGATVELQPVRE